MEIRSESRIKHPQDRVFAVYRDRLPEVAKYIPDIKEVIVKKREEAGDVIKLHNEWASDRDIPSVLKAFLKPEYLRWDDFATWNETGKYCDWTIKTRVFTDSFVCSGRNSFIADGQETRVVLTGNISINLKELPGVPSFLAKRVGPQLEQFIVSTITPNLEQVNKSLQRFMDEKS